MGTTVQKLDKLLETKAAIKQSIANKGVPILETDPFTSYPSKIDSIVSGTSEFFDLEDWANEILDDSVLTGEILIIRVILATDTSPLFEDLTSYYTNSGDKFLFSDSPTAIISGQHIHNWDTSKDIQKGNNKYRWIITCPAWRPVVLSAVNSYTTCLVVRTNGLANPSTVRISDRFTQDMRLLEVIDFGGLRMDDNTYFYLRETYSLHTIKNFHYYDVNNSQSSNNVTLVNIQLANDAVIYKNLDFRNGAYLTKASLLNIIDHLATVETTQYLEIGSYNLAKLTDVQKAVATSKNWTLS